MLKQSFWLIFILFIIILTASAQAQTPAPIPLAIFVDDETLTVYISGNQIVSLYGLGFEVTRNGVTQTTYLQNYLAFGSLPFDRLPAPLCFRLQATGSQKPLPQTCNGATTLQQAVAAADVFWYDAVANQTLAFLVVANTTSLAICGAGNPSCSLSYSPPQAEATPVPAPTLHSPTLAPTPDQPDEIALALAGVESNAAWTRYSTVDDKGIEMLLVPAGCFRMGSLNGEGDRDETPAHQQCFERPFWIDRTETTRDQYVRCAAEGYCATKGMDENQYSSQGNQPINQVTWYYARNYCQWRGNGTRLPTEAEWEYAARGPDNLIYPWGNLFEADKVVFFENSGATAYVGSRPAGVSWVGAVDMAGNLREWTSSLYAPYPYLAEDGREALDNTNHRVLRGGSFYGTSPNLRTADRSWYNPDSIDRYFGFRCVSPYE